MQYEFAKNDLQMNNKKIHLLIYLIKDTEIDWLLGKKTSNLHTNQCSKVVIESLGKKKLYLQL